MLQAIRGARHTITFESDICWSGEIGAKFTEALAERPRVAAAQKRRWDGSVRSFEQKGVFFRHRFRKTG